MSLPTPNPSRSWLRSTLLVLAATVASPLIATAIVSGKSSVEKMLTDMAQPFFLMIVLALTIGCILMTRGERWLGAQLAIAGALLWCCSARVVVNSVITYWESSLTPTEITELEEPFDYIVVLGGGTSVAPDGRAQLDCAGDRVGLAATLYLTGKTKNLVTTGDNLIMTGGLSGTFRPSDDPSIQTKQIWTKLGIPSDAISELDGQNTSSEIKSLHQHTEYWLGKRCGILTSAFHLPRAMRLAERAGVIALPIAADYRGSSAPLSINGFLPDVQNLSRLQTVFKEWLALQIGR